MLVYSLDLPVSTSLWDSVYDFYSILGIAAGVITFGIMFYLVLKYRSKDGTQPPLEKQRENRNTWKGPLVTMGLMAVVLVLVGVQTLSAYPITQNVPNASTSPFGGCSINQTIPSLTFHRVPNAGINLNVCVTARQFFWSFTYPNNQTVTELVVPVGRVVVLNVTSVDVYHQFGIPSFRMKTDALPGRFNVIWIKASEIGNSTIQCFELCGVGHATMITTLVVVSNSDYVKWYNSFATNSTGGNSTV